MTTNLNILAKEIIEKNQYLTIASDNWASPVCYTFDQNYNFYWVSMPSSRHSQNIAKNNQISIAIFDSHQSVDTGVGLQIEGTAQKLGISDYLKILKLYFGRNYPFGKISLSFKKLLDNKTYFFYKLTPTTVWINNPDSESDERVKVNLT